MKGIIKPTNSTVNDVAHTHEVSILLETKTLYKVTFYVGSNFKLWTFSKKDMLRTGTYKNEFPRFKLSITGEQNAVL